MKAAVNVLLVEDDEAHAELISRAFAGAEGEWALGRADSLSAARRALAATPFDLVIADYRLPDGEGLEIIAEEGPPCVILSSHGSESVAADAIKRGALDYVVKSPEGFASMPEQASRALRAWGLLREKREAEAGLRRSLAEKEVLLREVHHRVKNNFQIISSILSLQAACLVDAAARAVLLSSENRIRSMALIHEKLYEAEDFTKVDFADYMVSMAAALETAYHGPARGISLCIDAQPLLLPLDTAIPLGLILNELVTNALVHAFPQGCPGRIVASLAKESGAAILSVSDDGAGLPEGLEPQTAKTLGFELVRILATQAKGKIELGPGPGTRIIMRAPIAPDPKAAAT